LGGLLNSDPTDEADWAETAGNDYWLSSRSRQVAAMSDIELIEGPLTKSVIGAFFEVYNTLGYGFLEHLYVTGLERELLERGHQVFREVSVPVTYKGHHLGNQRIDIIVDDRLVVEVKSSLELPPVAKRQLFNYLKATSLEVGLLLHFGPTPRFYRHVALNNYHQVLIRSGSSV
jgi:GxxExxY protein